MYLTVLILMRYRNSVNLLMLRSMYKVNQPKESDHPESFLLPMGVLFYGNIESQTPGRIDGNVYGNVTVNSKLIVGEEAMINGNISAVQIIVQGTVEGNIDCETKLVICNSAIINGDIIAETIDIKEGSVINGSVSKRGGKVSEEKFIIRVISTEINHKKIESKKSGIAVRDRKTVEENALVSNEGWF